MGNTRSPVLWASILELLGALLSSQNNRKQEEHEDNENTHRQGFLPHFESTRGAKAEGSDDGPPPQRGLVVAVPVHAVLLVAVQIAE